MKSEAVYLRKLVQADGSQQWTVCYKDDPGAVMFTNELAEDEHGIVIISSVDGLVTARSGRMTEDMLGYGARGYSRSNYVDAYRGLAMELWDRSDKRKDRIEKLKSNIAAEERRIASEKKQKVIEKHGGWWAWRKAGRPSE